MCLQFSDNLVWYRNLVWNWFALTFFKKWFLKIRLQVYLMLVALSPFLSLILTYPPIFLVWGSLFLFLFHCCCCCYCFEALFQWCLWFQKIFQPINLWFRSGNILFCIMWHFFFCFMHVSSCHPDWCWTCDKLPSSTPWVLDSWVCTATPKTLTFLHLHAWDEHHSKWVFPSSLFSQLLPLEYFVDFLNFIFHLSV